MRVKENLKLLLMRQCGTFFSGTAIAKQLGVSRNAVWKAVQELKEDGIPVESHPKLGYRLPQHSDVLSAELLKQLCHAKTIGTNWIHLEQVNSTNTYCKELAAKGVPHGTAVLAELQTSGRGRLGRTFCSPKGTGLYLSLLLRPDYPMDIVRLVTACTAVAVAETVDRLTGASTQIKWVNDLFLGGKKYCGILTEGILSCETGRLDALVIGIGINLRTAPDLPEDVAAVATSIEAETGKRLSRGVLAAAIVEALEEQLSHLEEKAFLTAYRNRSMLMGKTVTVLDGNQRYTAVVQGIDEAAGLCVTLEDGSKRTLYSGEVSVRL